jgi:hypothetical protein
VKEDTLYSTPWKTVNTTANKTVPIKPYRAPLLLPWITEWWAYVTVTPEDSKMTVFRRGNSKAFIASIPIGGHWAPNSIVGARELWKKAQNIAKKNKASETIKRATPILSPFCTARVWFPKYVPSLITSRHHNDIDNTRVNSAATKKGLALLNPWIDNTVLVVKVNKAIEVNIGQGDGDTRWKGWPWKLLLVELVIVY